MTSLTVIPADDPRRLSPRTVDKYNRENPIGKIVSYENVFSEVGIYRPVKKYNGNVYEREDSGFLITTKNRDNEFQTFYLSYRYDGIETVFEAAWKELEFERLNNVALKICVVIEDTPEQEEVKPDKE